MQLGKFEILEELGRGGFGIVYKARDMALDRLVALKILHPELLINHDFLRRFRQEARIAAQLDHPNLVPVYEFGESKGRYYIVMGYMAGGSLKELLKREGRLEPERAREVLGQISAGLTYAHRRGIIHRDLKPGNILFDGEGRARVSDMGFARLLGGESSLSMTGTGGIVGTPAYMAPEIWRGKGAGAAADVYSAACILVEMLTGKVLFEGESTPEVMFKHFEPLRLPDGLPREWIPAIEQALEKEPEERTGAVEELVSGLRAQGPDEVDGGRQAEEEEEPEPEETGSGAGEQPPEEGEGETETAPEPQRPKKPALYLMLGLLAVVAGFLIISQTTKPTMVRTFECKQVVDVPREECEALVSLYNSTKGDRWKHKYNWKKSTRVGSWYGITVSGGHVAEIYLPDNQLSGSIPPELGLLTNLQFLWLSYNQLSGRIPPELGRLTKLQTIWISYNQLSGSIPPEFGQLTNLVSLDLASNQLSGSIPPELGQLTNLEQLFLYDNYLSGSIPPELVNLKKLGTLSLRNNRLDTNAAEPLASFLKRLNPDWNIQSP